MKRPSIADGLTALVWFISVLFLSWIPAQNDFNLILWGTLFSFAAYFFLVFRSNTIALKTLILLAIIARLLVIPSFPNLSDDIYRFIWDGRLWHLDIHPYSVLPSEVVAAHSSLSSSLYDALNSQGYYSIYPPIPQLIFWCATTVSTLDFSFESTVMKSIHALFDIGSLFILMALLKAFSLPKKRVLIYALNPLIIIELVANLHHECIVIFFLFLALLLLKKERIILAGIFFSCSVATKILPILFFPLLFFYLKGRSRWQFAGAVVVTIGLLFYPLLANGQILTNVGESANLYIQKFEFNASIYYVLREIGYVVKGYNLIHILGPWLMGLAGILILAISTIPIRRKIDGIQLFVLMMWAYLAYAFCSITLHPWYVALLVPLSCFTAFRTSLIWTMLILLTYVNYSYPAYHEHQWIVMMEYLIVYAGFIWEIKRYGFLSMGQSRDPKFV